jgi:hypothetical protein
MELFGALVGVSVWSAIAAVIGALFIMFASKWVLGFSPNYGQSWLISFFHQIAATVINITANLMFLNESTGGFFKKLAATSFSSNSLLAGITIMLAITITIFLAQSGITYKMINYENKSFGNSLKIMGIIWGIILLIILSIGLPLGILIYHLASNAQY